MQTMRITIAFIRIAAAVRWNLANASLLYAQLKAALRSRKNPFADRHFCKLSKTEMSS